MCCVGVLALQGGFGCHRRALERIGHRAVEVRRAEDFDGLDGLVLPGGESSVQLRLLERHHMSQPLVDFVRSGAPVLATCAGLILAAARVVNPNQPSFGLLDIAVTRNAWGRQLDSFEERDDSGGLSLVFIRAPRIQDVGKQVEVLATLKEEPVLVRQGKVVGATFHPELTGESAVHELAFGDAGVMASSHVGKCSTWVSPRRPT